MDGGGGGVWCELIFFIVMLFHFFPWQTELNEVIKLDSNKRIKSSSAYVYQAQ